MKPTDSRKPVPASQQTLDYLRWKTLLEAAANFTASALGRETLLRRGFLQSYDLVETHLSQVVELKELLENGGAPPVQGVVDCSPLVTRASRDGVLSAMELLEISSCVMGMSRITGYLRSHSESLSAARSLLPELEDVRAVGLSIDGAIQPDGAIRDEASSELHKARNAATSMHHEVKARLDRFMKTTAADEALQERYYTVREDRYVLPVRSERQSLVEGIIHAVSQTGATVFIEPQFLIGLNNRLKNAQEAVRRAEQRVLSDLTDVVARHASSLNRNLEVIARFDALVAKARFAAQLGGSRPQLTRSNELQLFKARSPLLLLQGTQAVANDFVISEKQPVLVLSGPNAGGKSVALTTLGQCLLMVRAGFLPPASPDSVIPVVDAVHAVPGDLENMEEQLSTFTGHLHALNGVLEQCAENEVVLIDEITVGTEPEQGAALGAAYLNAFSKTGALVMVATHYERIKALAAASPRMENASMGIRWDTLSPTYRMEMGTPGSSRTIDIARRSGTKATIVDEAASMLEGGRIGELEEAVRRLSAREEDLARVQERNEIIHRDIEQLQQRHRLALEQLDRQAETIVRDKVRKATAQTDEALEKVDRLLEGLKASMDNAQDLASRRRALGQVRSELRKEVEAMETQAMVEKLSPAADSGPMVGKEVFVKRYRRKATVLSVEPTTGMLRLAMGPMRVQVPESEVVALEDSGGKPAPRTGIAVTALPEPPRRLDLRGTTSDEALEQLERLLDQMVFQPGGEIVVVHGHGTGKLKREVRTYLESTRYAIDYRPGKREEGGDGVTIISVRT